MFQNIRSKAKEFFQDYEKADKPSHQILGGKLIDIGMICTVDCREGYGGKACNPARTSTTASLSPVNPSLDRQYHALQQPYPNPKSPKHAWKQPLCPKTTGMMTVIERQMPLGVREVEQGEDLCRCTSTHRPTGPHVLVTQAQRWLPGSENAITSSPRERLRVGGPLANADEAEEGYACAPHHHGAWHGGVVTGTAKEIRDW